MDSQEPEKKAVAKGFNYPSSAFEPLHEDAGNGWRIAAGVTFVAFLASGLAQPIREHATANAILVRLFFLIAPLLIVVALSQTVHANRTDKTRVKVFCFASTLGIVAIAAWFTVPHKYFLMPFAPDKSKLTAEDFRERGRTCMGLGDFECAEENWADYVARRPTDGKGLANLAIAMHMRGLHADAVVQFKKAVDAGESAYDLFAYYALSLEKLEQVDEAIDWNYRALSLSPTLLDVRGRLASLLAKRKQYHEALLILDTYYGAAAAAGPPAHFAAIRSSIQSSLASEPTNPATQQSLRVPKIKGIYRVPVRLGRARETVLILDPRAPHTTLYGRLLEESNASFRITNPRVVVTTVDGRQVVAQEVAIQSLTIGPFTLDEAQALVCDQCVVQLGQMTLSRFDTQSSRVQGVEFLTLTRRDH